MGRDFGLRRLAGIGRFARPELFFEMEKYNSSLIMQTFEM
jgi:hypothetical protein